jgi:tRNA (guanine-N7-)-methyltransferase
MRMLGSEDSYKKIFTNRCRNINSLALAKKLMQQLNIREELLSTKVSIDELFETTLSKMENWLEIGFGTGDHLYEQMVQNRHVRFIGCEPFTRGVMQLCNKILLHGDGAQQNYNSSKEAGNSLAADCASDVYRDNTSSLQDYATMNLRLLHGPAGQLMSHLESNVFSKIFLLFPDPWPKKKQQKRRIFSQSFLNDALRLLTKHGELRIASDNETYIHEIAELLAINSDSCKFQIVDYDDSWPRTKYLEKAIHKPLVINAQKII